MSDRTTYAWAAPYAGLDDDALKALGNAGLLRRARKDTVTEVSHDAKGAVLDVSGVTVRVDGRGPAAVACDCPTAGVCQHVLTACLWATGGRTRRAGRCCGVGRCDVRSWSLRCGGFWCCIVRHCGVRLRSGGGAVRASGGRWGSRRGGRVRCSG